MVYIRITFIALFVSSIATAAPPDFRTDIRPILERSCYSCHGPEKQKSSYRLDIRDLAIRGGDSGQRAIVPHASADSALLQRLSHPDPAERMPPANADVPPLTDHEIQMLAAWIDHGPVWPDALAGEISVPDPHWSLEPIVRTPPPLNAPHPIDAFIRQTLEVRGLAPSPPADKATLLRRLYIDLIGLPPTPEELDDFLSDNNPNAYVKQVDALLQTPRYGERWARHWLDTIHFADSHGYEHDLARDHAWRYRDYVIESLNNDIPYTRFIREQLAADFFYPEDTHLTAALGFLGAGNFDLSTYITSTTTFDYLDRDDLVTQTMAAFTGTTANCARCHDHKFDPIPQEDYYALQAVFAGVLKGNITYDANPQVARDRQRWTNFLDQLENDPENAIADDALRDLARTWLDENGSGARWLDLNFGTFLSAEGADLVRVDGNTIIARGHRPDKDTYTVTASTSLDVVTAIRLEVLALDELPLRGPGRADNGNLHLSEIALHLFEPGAPQPQQLTIARGSANFNQTDWEIDHAIDSDRSTAWGIHPQVGRSHVAVFELETPAQIAPGACLSVTLEQQHGGSHLIGAFRLSATGDSAESAIPFSPAAAAALAKPEVDRTQDEQHEIVTAILQRIALRRLEELPEQAVVYAASPSVEIPDGETSPKYAALDGPKPVHLMIRGDFNRPAEEVHAGSLSALENLPARFTIENAENESARRAALADWLIHPDNVLTWRCIVNRVWHYHFGRGLCDTPNDLGRMGGEPSHPALLDWLALWFRDEADGSLKSLHRLIVTSETYKQASDFRDNAAEIDSDNRLLWRHNVLRVDADTFRDSILALSGSLDLTMGGPGVRYFTESQGPQITPALDYDAYDWRNAEKSRRSIYRFVWRGIPDPLMEALDFPDLGLLSPRRAESVSSIQALALYNHDFVLAHSEALAQRVQAESDTLEGQVARAVNLVWLREPTMKESAAFTKFAHENGFSALSRVLFNSNQFLFVD